MNSTPSIQDLARRLTAIEAACAPANGLIAPVEQACDKLRIPLTKLAGEAGFRSLMTRAKALASTDDIWLANVQVAADGSLQGFSAARAEQGAGHGEESGTALLTQLLGLLVTFIGESLTLQLVQDAWPELSAAVPHMRTAEGS